MRPKTIAIDGPAGSGKSTVGRVLAQRLGYAMLDTGVLYRLVAWKALEAAIDPGDAASIVPLTTSLLSQVSIAEHIGGLSIIFETLPLTDLPLHTAAVSRSVPIVARHPGVREQIRRIQHRMVKAGPVILAGRDIGTVVAPNADLKLYLDVSLKERAARRLWASSDIGMREEDIERSLAERDALDRARSASPLRVPDDAIVIRTDKLSVDETVDAIVSMCGLEA